MKHSDFEKSRSAESRGNQWWLAIDNQPTGPFSWDGVADQIRSGKCGRGTLICRIGGNAWGTLGESPEFGGVFNQARASKPIVDPLLCGDLPWMANGICIYCLAISPVLCVLNFCLAIASGTAFHGDSGFFVIEFLMLLTSFVVGLAATIALAWGGVQLRRLRRSGAMTILVTLSLYIAYSVLMVVTMIILIVAAGASGANHGSPDEPGETVAGIVDLFLSTTNFAVEIWMAVWLALNIDKIQWKSS